MPPQSDTDQEHSFANWLPGSRGQVTPPPLPVHSSTQSPSFILCSRPTKPRWSQRIPTESAPSQFPALCPPSIQAEPSQAWLRNTHCKNPVAFPPTPVPPGESVLERSIGLCGMLHREAHCPHLVSMGSVLAPSLSGMGMSGRVLSTPFVQHETTCTPRTTLFHHC